MGRQGFILKLLTHQSTSRMCTERYDSLVSLETISVWYKGIEEKTRSRLTRVGWSPAWLPPSSWPLRKGGMATRSCNPSSTYTLPILPASAGQGEHSHSLSASLAAGGQPAAATAMGGWQPVLEPADGDFSVKKLYFFQTLDYPLHAEPLAYKAAVSCVSSKSGLTTCRCSSEGACSAGYEGFSQRLCNAKK